jgi:hypothetical protein
MTHKKEIDMKSKMMSLSFSVLTLAVLLSPRLANAQSCSAWAADIIAQYESSTTSLGARVATNRSDGQYVSYAVSGEYPLAFVPAHGLGASRVPASLQAVGALTQFFSNRLYDWNGNSEPFSPVATDSLGMTIWLGNGGAYSPGLGYAIKPGEVTFTLYSWGDAIVTFTPERCDGMIYGLNGNTGLLVSLFPQQPPPR